MEHHIDSFSALIATAYHGITAPTDPGATCPGMGDPGEHVSD